jgi:hypothetical protein
MVQTVECPLSKHEALSSKPSTTKKKKKEEESSACTGRIHFKKCKRIKVRLEN